MTRSDTDDLSERLARIERRLEALEAWRTGEHVQTSPAKEPVEPSDAEPKPIDFFNLSLAGRTLVVLAGAFALRAITETGAFPQIIGTALGFAYAMLWIVLSDRAVGAGRRTSATFHGVAAAIIGFPLLWEATARFEILSGVTGLAALSAFTATALIVAQRRSLRRLAWVFTAGAVATAVALAVATKMLVLFAAFLLLLGLATMWLGYIHRWRGPGWLAAVAVDGTVLLMTLMVLLGDGERVAEVLRPASLVAIQVALVVLYMGGFGLRTLTRGRDLRPAEIAQGLVVLLAGLGGAVAVTHVSGLSSVGLGLVSLLLAAGCYGVSFAVMDRHLGSRVNFVFYTSSALTFTVVAVMQLLAEPARPFAFSGIALVVAALGSRRSRATLSLHAAVYVAAAAVTSGLLVGSIEALAGPAPLIAGWITTSGMLTLLVAAACGCFPVASHGRTWGRLSGVPKLALLVVVALGTGGILVNLLAPFARVANEPTIEPGALAALRTCILAVSAVTLAWLGCRRRFIEAGWLVYPVLIAGGLKLLLEDVRAGRPLTLFVSLAFYGGALIVAPRIARRGGKNAPSSPSAPPPPRVEAA